MESESEDEVMIHNPPHPIPTHHNVSPVPPAADGCKEDNLTLLALAKPAMARSRQKRKAQAVREHAGPVRPSRLLEVHAAAPSGNVLAWMASSRLQWLSAWQCLACQPGKANSRQ